MVDNIARDHGSSCATCAQGTARLSECLIRHFDRILFIVAARMSAKLSQHVHAEDLAHEVIVEALEHHHKFEYRGEARFVGWISTLAQRVVSDSVRRHGRVPPTLSIRNDDEAEWAVRPSRIPGQTSTPSSIVARTERCRQVREVLATLRDQDRAVIRMVQLEGRSVREVAAHIGCSTEAAAKRLSRALARLGAEVTHHCHELSR